MTGSVKTKGIVLQNIKYGENNIISHIFTKSNGRLSFFVRGGSKKKNKYRNLLFPLNILTIEFKLSTKKELQYFSNINSSEIPIDFFSSPEKSPVVFLLSEIFEKTLKPEDVNKDIFQFINQVIIHLQTTLNPINSIFIQVLVIYLKLLGIAPSSSSKSNSFFDLESSLYSNEKPVHPYFFNIPETIFFTQLLNTTNLNTLPVIPLNIRHSMIEKLIKYYQIQLGVGEIKSFNILKSMYLYP